MIRVIRAEGNTKRNWVRNMRKPLNAATPSSDWRRTAMLCSALWALFLVMSSPVQANDSAAQNVREIPLEVKGAGPWFRAVLPMQVRFAAAFADLRDLRVLNANGDTMPFALLPSSERQAHNNKIIEARFFPLYLADQSAGMADVRVDVNASGQVIAVRAPQEVNAAVKLRGWLLDLGDRHDRLFQLMLDAAQIPEGFQRFSIEASNDLQHWQHWSEGQWVNLSFEGEQIKQNVIALSGGQARYLRLVWQQPTEAPILTAASVVNRLTQTQEAALTWSEPLPAPTKSEENSYLWGLPLALPLERLRVESLAANTVAPVDVSGRVYPQPHAYSQSHLHNDHYKRQLSQWRSMILHGHKPSTRAPIEPAWQLLACSVLSRVPVNGVESLQNEISLPALPVQQLRLHWDTRGSGLGETAPTVRVAMTEIQVVFLAQGNPPYRLNIGNVDAKPANLPLNTLIPGYAGESTLQSMGQATVITSALSVAMPVASPTAIVTDDGRKKLMLWGILLLGVGLLGGMVWQLLRKPA